jgi:hypothetical protein
MEDRKNANKILTRNLERKRTFRSSNNSAGGRIILMWGGGWTLLTGLGVTGCCESGNESKVM